MNTGTNLAAAAVAASLSVVSSDASNAVTTAPRGRQVAPDYAARGRELIHQFAMSRGNQPFASNMALPRP